MNTTNAPGQLGSDPSKVADSTREPAKRRLNVKGAINLRLSQNSALGEAAEQLARDEPDETTRREFLLSMIAPKFRASTEVQELCRLLGVMKLIGPDDPLLSQFTDWNDQQGDERRMRVLEIAGSKLPEDVLWLMARPDKPTRQRADYAMDNHPQL